MKPYYENKNGKLYHGDCLDIMPGLDSCDMILTDPPYQITACKWDIAIPFEPMWERINRLIKKNGAVVLFGSEPFSSTLRMSNIKNYKYDWIWEKSVAGNPLLAKHQPLRIVENICVFYKKKNTYNRQMVKVKGKVRDQRTEIAHESISKGTAIGISKCGYAKDYNPALRNPKNIIKINSIKGVHPTQKPVALMEYLIKTYTNEGDTVLDFCSGSGTTAVACEQTYRNWILIEKEEKYCEISAKRIEQAHKLQKRKFGLTRKKRA